VIGSGTTVIPGAGLIATPGGVDSHVHFVTPRLMPAALDGG
jgi:urease subunit alpha